MQTIGEILSPDNEWMKYLDACKPRWESLICVNCGPNTKKAFRREEAGKAAYARVYCATCNAFMKFLPKPENINKRVTSSLNCAKHGLYCEMCLRPKSELPNGCNIQGHHVEEHQFGGETTPENIWDLCARCHELIGWARKTYGHNETKKEIA